MRKSAFLLPAVVVILALGLASIFVVDEREKALVLQFGQIVGVKEEPGLGLKIPLIQQVVRYDDRILSIDTDPIEVTPSDDRRLEVDAFARYRIADVVQFRQAVGAGGIRNAEDRLTNILNSQIREVLGADQVTSNTILSEDRRNLMNRIRDSARLLASDLGIDVVDVRLKQTNLPEQNLDATFARMRAEREREAEDERARGREAAQRVTALADRTVTETLSEAQRDAEITRGEADAAANRIFGEAYGTDPEFFDFYRSMQAYRLALQPENSTMVMTPTSSFFDYLLEADPTAERGAQDGSAAPAGTAAPSSAAPAADAGADAETTPAAEVVVPATEPQPQPEPDGAAASDADATPAPGDVLVTEPTSGAAATDVPADADAAEPLAAEGEGSGSAVTIR